MVRRPGKEPAMTNQLCFAYDNTIELVQTGFDKFTVRYGLQVKENLDYGRAAAELGACIMHSVACDGRLDSRDASEARTTGDRRPFFGNPVPAKVIRAKDSPGPGYYYSNQAGAWLLIGQ